MASRGLIVGAIVVIVVVAAAVLLMSGGGKQAATTPATTMSQPAASPGAGGQASTATAGGGGGGSGVIKIGGTVSLQGKFAHEGKMGLCGFRVAVKWVNEHGGVKVGGKTYKLDYIYYDDKSSKDEVQKLYTKLITEDKVDFLMAPYSSSLTLAAVPITDQYGKLLISWGGASDKIFEKGYKYIVQTLSPASKYLASAIDFLASTGDKDIKIAIIYENSAFASVVASAAKKYAEEKGLKVVFFQSYPKGTTDFAQIIVKAKESGANVLLGGGHFQDGLQLVKQAYDLGWRLKFISILVAPVLPEFYKQLGSKVAEGVSAPAQWEIGAKYSPEAAKKMGFEWYGPTGDEFVKMFKEECGEEPSYHAASAAASVFYLVKAIERAGSLDVDKVRQAFNGLKLMTFFGPLEIDPKTGKQIAHPMLLVQWQNGKKVIIWPESAATGKPVYPVKNWWER